MCTIKATLRKEHGKGASRRLRIENKFPAIIYGGKSDPILIELDNDSIMNMQVKSKFYSEVLTIVIDNQEIKVKIQSIQRHPFKLKFQHIDFIRF